MSAYGASSTPCASTSALRTLHKRGLWRLIWWAACCEIEVYEWDGQHRMDGISFPGISPPIRRSIESRRNGRRQDATPISANWPGSQARNKRITVQKDDCMATAKTPRSKRLPPLENGDWLDQKTFHARYEAMPNGFRAELIGGIVYVPSSQKLPHRQTQLLVVRWLDEYAEATPGTEALLNNTQILGPDSEPEPDACLFITPEYGGRVYVDKDDYLHGPPELIVEVSSSTESIDLHRKKQDYQKAGVNEYVVLALRTQQVF